MLFLTKKIWKNNIYVKSPKTYFLKAILGPPNTPIDSKIITYIININYLKIKGISSFGGVKKWSWRWKGKS